jgi:hypothetical protein
MKLKHLFFSAAVLLAMSSCVVGPGYRRPIVRGPVYGGPVVRPVVVPVGARPHYHGGVRYYNHRGVWYRPHGGGHIIVPRPY